MSLKPYTKYRCACGSTRWTGALSVVGSDDAVDCPCGKPWVEVVEDGHTYRVSWEAIGPHGGGWHSSHRDTTDRVGALNQYRTLAEWERTGREAVRNVGIAKAAVTFVPLLPAEIAEALS